MKVSRTLFDKLEKKFGKKHVPSKLGITPRHYNGMKSRLQMTKTIWFLTDCLLKLEDG